MAVDLEALLDSETRATVAEVASGVVIDEKTRAAIERAFAPQRELAAKFGAVSQQFAPPPWLEKLGKQLAEVQDQAQAFKVPELRALPAPRLVDVPALDGDDLDEHAEVIAERESAEDEARAAALETASLLRNVVDLQAQMVHAITTIAAEAHASNRSQTRRFWFTLPLAVLAALGVYPVLDRLLS